ncbi:hypothetical protein DL96DRAFT_1612005 [Flagelloscypha sp. PMI_526]|nr:hypothetical protein DL96DRAFT_1612005 [Flagelloscypha sp. PMI_526]
MPPKKNKAQKVSLNEFLGDSTLGSWADEMDSLPNAPAIRSDDDSGRDRFSRRGDDFLSSRPDRQAGPPREDLPLPTAPPYTAFVGNLAFDLTETELEDFFAPLVMKSVKIIRDRDDKPKGFGYVEFADLDGLKEGLSKSGQNFSNRQVRISVAEPPKERDRPFGGSGGFDDDKFDSPWRRDKPLPPSRDDFSSSRDSSRRRFDGPPDRERLPSVSEGINDWRSAARPARTELPPPSEPPQFKRRGSGFGAENSGLADSEEKWTIGGKFKPSASDEPAEGAGAGGGRFGSMRRGSAPGGGVDPLPPKEDEGDWRSANRPPRSTGSPTGSVSPTPPLARRKLELLPRSNANSVPSSPVSSPRFPPTAKANPFGAAKAIDASAREKEIEDKMQNLSMSRTSSQTGMARTTSRPDPAWKRTTSRPGMERTSSRQGTERGGWRDRPARKPEDTAPSPIEKAEKKEEEKEKPPVTIAKRAAPTVRPGFSFASALSNKDADTGEEEKEE